eukprot:26706_6
MLKWGESPGSGLWGTWRSGRRYQGSSTRKMLETRCGRMLKWAQGRGSGWGAGG